MGQAIIDVYAPDAIFNPTLTRDSEHQYDATHETNRIQWRITHGLPTLFHEIGHLKFKHSEKDNLKKVDQWTEYLQEVEAWLYAEHKCKLYGISFDYVDAEHCLERRRRKKGIPKFFHIRWRYTTSVYEHAWRVKK